MLGSSTICHSKNNKSHEPYNIEQLYAITIVMGTYTVGTDQILNTPTTLFVMSKNIAQTSLCQKILWIPSQIVGKYLGNKVVTRN